MKPDWCPQGVWELVNNLPIQGDAFCDDCDLETIARALLQAEQRGRRKGMEDVSETIKKYRDLDGSTGAEWDDGYEAACAVIAAAIRAKLGEVQK